MTKKPLARAAVLAAFLVLPLSAALNSAAAAECEAQINNVLQERGVNQSDVKSVKVVRRTGGAKSSNIYSLDAWVRLNSCSNGALVVNMTKYCMVQSSYTTGDCNVTGMPRY
jgi:hypothetical protein